MDDEAPIEITTADATDNIADDAVVTSDATDNIADDTVVTTTATDAASAEDQAVVIDADLDNTINVVTHNGRFHLDEIAAVALIGMMHNCDIVLKRDQHVDEVAINTLVVTRTRDPELLAAAIGDPHTYVVDVGGVYSPYSCCFDHHQKSFDTSYAPQYEFAMSSCGIVWKEFAGTILHALVDKHKFLLPITGLSIDTLADKAYHDFFAGIDANDNGVKHIKSSLFAAEFAYPNALALPEVIGQLNRLNPGDPDDSFMKGVDIVKTVITAYLVGMLRTETEYAAHEEILRTRMLNRVHPEILDLTSAIADSPVRSVSSSSINRYLKREDPGQEIKFIIVHDKSLGSTSPVRLHTVNYRLQNFKTYVPIVGDVAMPGPDITFVHKGRFLAGATTVAAALALAEDSLEAYYSVSNMPARVWRWLLTH